MMLIYLICGTWMNKRATSSTEILMRLSRQLVIDKFLTWRWKRTIQKILSCNTSVNQAGWKKTGFEYKGPVFAVKGICLKDFVQNTAVQVTWQRKTGSVVFCCIYAHFQSVCLFWELIDRTETDGYERWTQEWFKRDFLFSLIPFLLQIFNAGHERKLPKL